MNKREWLLAATALGATLAAADAQAQAQRPRQAGPGQPSVVQAPQPAPQQPRTGQIGTTGAVNPNARQTAPSGGATRLMFVGSGLFQNERINTDGGGQAHLLFADQSALTVGPNSDIVLDRFVYDPARDTGSLAIQAGRGVLRFVGGRVSKTGEVNINTPAGTIGIRGGVAVIAFINGRWFVAFFYGDYVNVAGIPITRPGFGMNIGDSSPHPLTQQEIAQLLALLQGGNGQPPVPNLVFDPGQRPDWLTPDALQAWLAGLGGTSTGPDRGVDTWGPIIQLLTEGNNQGNRGNLIVPVPPPPPQVLPPPPPPPPPSYF